MKTLGNVTATSEQLTVIDNSSPGFWLIRGAAGSGKTTTALLRLKFLVRYWRERRADLGLQAPVRVLVLTFNRTLRGYIAELAEQQIPSDAEVDLEISTFGFWSQQLLGQVLLENGPQSLALKRFAGGHFPWADDFLLSEVNYVLGLYMPDERGRYVTAERTGRGRSPTVERGEVRQRLISEVIEPYEAWKRDRGVVDWNDLAVELALEQHTTPYDIVVVDEAQDFSANQIRAVVNHLANEFVCTFIRDTTQRIYPNVFVWRDLDVRFPANQSRRLQINYRNTKEIAAFVPAARGRAGPPRRRSPGRRRVERLPTPNWRGPSARVSPTRPRSAGRTRDSDPGMPRRRRQTSPSRSRLSPTLLRTSPPTARAGRLASRRLRHLRRGLRRTPRSRSYGVSAKRE